MIKKTLLISSLCLFIFSMPTNAKQKIRLNNNKAKESYSIGFSIGKGFKAQEIKIEYEALLQGIKDSADNGSPLMSQTEIEQTLKGIQDRMRKKMNAEMSKKRQEQGKINEKAGSAFLRKNKKRKGVITLSSGLQYEKLKEGKGEKPKKSDTVVTNYRGTTIDGKEFDSSYKRGKSATFTVGGVIVGWQEALQLMKPGAKWKLYIPPKLGYGERGAGQMIGPNETLIFEIELLEIKK
jgi:FKBP-type peptidyl-prolyl cis-trans isomerase FklB